MSKKVCPECGGVAGDIYGNGWDWDIETCFERGCDYEKELDTMTYCDENGKVTEVHQKPKDDEE